MCRHGRSPGKVDVRRHPAIARARQEHRALRPTTKRRRLFAVPAPAYDRPMISPANIAELASLVGYPARANMLLALVTRQAPHDIELTFLDVSPPPPPTSHPQNLAGAQAREATRLD